MIIKQHLCGLAIAYEPHRLSTTEKTPTGRPQGSRYSQQKRKVADAIEWMRLYGDHKPLIFVATSPGFTSLANEQPLISKLTHNLRNGYGIKNYVWVREATKKGFPHFHFVVDSQFIDAKKLSAYWSSLFDSDANNSIRLGTKPDKNGKRLYYIHNSKMSFYMGKYFGKDVDKSDDKSQLEFGKRRPRTFHITKDLAKNSLPKVFGEEITLLFNGLHQRNFTLSNDQCEDYYERGESPPSLNPYRYDWQWTGHGQTYIGRPKKWKTKTKPAGGGQPGK